MTAARDERVLSSDVRAQALHAEPGAADEPSTSALALNRLGGVEIGIWSIEPGVAPDVEADEVFVVLSGRASVTIEREEGPAEVVEVGPGSAVRLNAGERTVWTVHETLRKVYVTTL